MMKAIIFLTDGFEEIEALSVIDILRRGNVEVTSASLTEVLMVEGAHNIRIEADCIISDLYGEEYEMLILPGGPGHKNYKNNEFLQNFIKEHNENNKYIAAICAAPSFLGSLGILEGKRAVCYPGFEGELRGAEISSDIVVTDGNVITAKGPGASIPFALELLVLLAGAEATDEVRKGIIFEK